MIIQCRQCRTKFRFDDALMQGNGVWLRCSRCGHVYFQDNPLIKRRQICHQICRRNMSGFLEEDVIAAKKSENLSTESPSVFYRDKNGVYSLDKVMETKKHLNEEINLGMEKTPEESISGANEKLKKKNSSPQRVPERHGKLLFGLFLLFVVIPAVLSISLFSRIW